MTKNQYLNLVLFAALMSISPTAFSQTSINTASHSATIKGSAFDYTIGEMTLISTERNANLIVTQGYLQPTDAGSASNSHTDQSALNNFADNLKVYPNPTENILFIESIETLEADISYTLNDAAGKILLSQKATQKAGLNKFSINLQNYASGTYFVVISKLDKKGISEKISFKVQKTN